MNVEKFLVIIVAWVIAAGVIIIPIRIRKKRTIPANTTLGDVVNAVHGIKDTIITAMGIEIGIIITAMVIINK